MKKIAGFFTIMTVLIFATSMVMAESVEFRTVVNKNDATVGGEFFLDLEMRITSGTSPKTLNSLTVDVYYGSELTEWSSSAGTGWAFGGTLGYTRSANKNSDYYRVLATGGGVNENEVECPDEGSPPGWDVTDSWQKMVTLRWTIAEATFVNISIDDDTDAAAYFVNYQNCFPQPIPATENWTVTNQDLGDTSLPVELAAFTALYGDDGLISIEWVTESEINNLGFYIYRSKTKDGEYIQVNEAMINGAGSSAMPNTYKYIDDTVDLSVETYFYYLEDVDIAGIKTKSHIIEVARKPIPAIPKKFALLQNYPNPYNPETWIPYALPVDTTVTMKIYNSTGRIVKTFFLGARRAGMYTSKRRAVYWDGKNEDGECVGSGIYFYAIEAGEFSAVKRMLMLK